jgi:uncharacterized secreted protein with C-terminal beta-propeller domain
MSTFVHYSQKFTSVIILSFMLCFLIGCNVGTEVGNPEVISQTVSGDMHGFDSNEELEAYLKDQYAKSVYTEYPYGLEDAARNDDGSAGGGAGGDGGAGALTMESSDSYTGTNVQEPGVDESDVLKTDGEYFYVADSDTVTVVRAANPMGIINTIQVKGSVDSMYLYGGILILLYTPLNYGGEPWIDTGMTDTDFIGIPYWIPIRAKTGVAFFDVSNPAAPVELKTIEADGYLASSRRIDNRLHIVQQFLPDLPAPYLLEDRIEAMTLEELIPFYSETTGSAGEDESFQLVAPENFYHPGIDGGGGIVAIMTFDLDDLDQPFSSIGVVANASIVYASTRALYCTSTYWHMIEESSDGPQEQTVIYKFDLTGDQVTGQGYQSVQGRALNQFSLGEYEDVLRIATTTGWSWGTEPTSKNHVYCLKSQEGKLEVIGKLEDLAPGEEIYAARFIGPRGYLVTFVTIDPLFTLDLSDPTSPQVVGELKVPGYSAYIHPVGDDYLITIGKDAIEEEDFAWYQGVQLSIFDISDFADPRLLHNEIIGSRGTSSEALYNHKAFTSWEANGLLAISIDLYEHQREYVEPWTLGTHTFRGLYVYRVGIQSGFEYIGRISTVSDIPQYAYYSNWTRGIFMDEYVYAVTSEAVSSAEVNDIEGTIQSLIIGNGQ